MGNCACAGHTSCEKNRLGGKAMSTSAFIKGMSAGLIVGSTVFMCCARKKRPGKKSMMGRALKNLGELVENVSDVMGL